MIVIQEPFITVTWDETNQWVFAEWHQNAAVETQIAIATRLLELSTQHKSRKLLVDTTIISVVVDETFQKWYTETWMPAASSNGLKEVAFIVPKAFLTRFKFYTANLKQPLETKELHIQYFDTKVDAETWLKNP
jgi:hypothetical protein